MGRIHLVTLIACAGLVRAEILFRDSFEEEGGVRWRSTWGKAERSQEKAHSGEWGVKESPENKHGLSVWYTEFPAYPKATYRARAWVFVPEQENAPAAALSFNQLTWNSLAVASTDQRGEWVQLAVELHNETETRLRLQLFQRGQGAGIGGSVMYWDDVVVERELGELALDDGMRINPHVKQGLDVTPDGGTSVRVAAGTINESHTPEPLSVMKIPVDTVLGEGQTIGPFTAIETHGHSDCGLSFHDPSAGVLVVSDATPYYFVEAGIYWPCYFTSYRRYMGSMRRLESLDAEVLCLGHSTAVTGTADIRAFFDGAIAATEAYHTRIVEEIGSGRDPRELANQLGEEIYARTQLLPVDFFQKNCALLVQQSMKHAGLSAAD